MLELHTAFTVPELLRENQQKGKKGRGEGGGGLPPLRLGLKQNNSERVTNKYDTEIPKERYIFSEQRHKKY